MLILLVIWAPGHPCRLVSVTMNNTDLGWIMNIDIILRFSSPRIVHATRVRIKIILTMVLIVVLVIMMIKLIKLIKLIKMIMVLVMVMIVVLGMVVGMVVAVVIILIIQALLPRRVEILCWLILNAL